MSTGHGNSDEIRQLASIIEQCREEADAALRRALHAIEQVDWNDSAANGYRGEHESVIRGALAGVAGLDTLPPNLRNHATRLDTYLYGR